MKKKIKKNFPVKVKNLNLDILKSFSNKTKKKFENFVNNYQKKRAKEKIENEKRLKDQRKKEILKEQRL